MKRIGCIFGRHWYKAGSAKSELLAENDKAWAYRIISECVYCGAENVMYVKIQKPPSVRKVKPRAAKEREA